jgi:LuxR family maltose regulon positive regulatory protein
MVEVDLNERLLEQANDKVLVRGRVQTLLSDALQKPAVAIIAGSGYGKTQEVYQYLQNNDIKTVWLQLSEADNNPSRFWETFCQAIAQINGDVSSALLAKGFPSNDEKIRFLGELLSNEIKPRYQYAVVFDDLHLIKNQDIHDLIAHVFDYSHLNYSTIFISRYNNLSKEEQLATTEQISYIGESDLCFSKNEMVDLFLLRGIESLPGQASQIHDETGGWPLAVALAANLMELHRDDVDYVCAALKHNVKDMIEENLFSIISPEAQKFLIKLSLINFLSIDIIQADENNRIIVDELMRTTSLIRYDSFLCVYRLHHLLFEFLCDKQYLLTEAEKADVHFKAARWCEANGHKLDALKYYEKIGDWNTIISLAFALPLIIPTDTANYLLEMLKRAPEEIFDDNPATRVIHTRLLLSLGMIEEAASQSNEYIGLLKQRPKTPENCRTLLGLYNNLGFAGLIICVSTGDYGFSKYFKEAVTFKKPSGFEPTGLVTVANLGPYACRISKAAGGEPERYIDAITETVFYAAQTMSGCMYGVDDLTRAEVAYYKLDSGQAEHHALRALSKSRIKGQLEVESKALFLLLRLYLHLGKYEKIVDILNQIDKQIDNQGFTNRHLLYEIEISWFYSVMGEHSRVASWLKSKDWLAGSGDPLGGFSEFARCKYYFTSKDYSTLLVLMDSQGNGTGNSKYLFGQISLAAYRAACYYHMGNKDEAIRWLGIGYELAGPNQIIMPFAEMGNSIRSLAGAALKAGDTGIPTEWLEMIRRKAATYAKRVTYVRSCYIESQHQGETVHLTSKELQVLEDLAQGLSRTEISLARDISVNTVKVMLPKIYDKLGAENSIDAVRIAASKRLL